MKVTGTSTMTADRATVWAALNDPVTLVATIPGCHRLVAIGPDSYTMQISAGVGSIKGVYDGEVHLTDQQEPGSFRMQANGAGAPGTIGADVRVTLEEGTDGGTVLTYEADAVVGGMIGGVGQRMLTGVSKKMAAEFFSNVDAALAAGGTGPPDQRGAPVHPAVPSPAPAPGAVYTAPQSTGRPAPGPGFALGVATGAAAALVGALVGAWISRRRA